MTDPRVEKLADLLITYSLKIRRGQTLLITGQPQAEPLIREAYRAAIRRGAHVETQIRLDGLTEIFFQEAKEAQLTWVSPFAKYRMKNVDALLNIGAEANTRALSGCDPKKMAKTSSARKALQKIFMKRSSDGDLRWVYTLWPNQANAQDADMSLADYEEFVFSAGHLDDRNPTEQWKAISKAQKALTTKLNRAKEVHILGEDTDLRFSVEGRTWENCDGQMNFPDGEVFTGPVEKSVEGHVRFSFPAVHHGREVQDAFLEFRNGKVVRAEASKGEDFLRAMVHMDKGSCYLGEAAFGTNYNITEYTRNTLFDEKIGGTMHLALGAGYPETGSKNVSGLHWDMVIDLRDKGEVRVDGTAIQKQGRFVNKRFPQPKQKKRTR